MIGHYHVTINAQPFLANAIIKALNNNVAISGSRKNVDPVHNGQGEEVCGKLIVNLVACAHGGDLYVNIAPKVLCANLEIGYLDDVVRDYAKQGRVGLRINL